MAPSTPSTPARAAPPIAAKGLWRYNPSIVDTRVAEGVTFLTTTEEGTWTGTFEGTSREEPAKVVIHPSGSWSFQSVISFVGKVNGRSGTMRMLVAGKRPDTSADWHGDWVIHSGTGDLATAYGEGTWWGPGSPGTGQWGDIHYSGRVYFGS